MSLLRLCTSYLHHCKLRCASREGENQLAVDGMTMNLSHIYIFTQKYYLFFSSENLSRLSQNQDANFSILLASEGALMNILYSAKERQKYGGKTAPKYYPLSQLLLGCNVTWSASTVDSATNFKSSPFSYSSPWPFGRL